MKSKKSKDSAGDKSYPIGMSAKRRVSSSRGGPVMNTRIYLALLDAYVETNSTRKAAALVGISEATAEHYISKGTVKFPCIRDRANKMLERSVKVYDVAKTRELQFIQSAQKNMLAQVGRVLGRVRLAPEGEPLVDENGQQVLDANGEPVLLVSTTTYRTIASTLRMLADLGDTTRERMGDSSSFEHATTVSATPVAVSAIAGKIGSDVDLNALGRSAKSSEFVEALAREESIRKRDQNG